MLLLLAAFSMVASSNGVVTAPTAGVPVRISSTSVKCAAYLLQALPSNTGHIYFGFTSAVSSSNAPVLNVTAGNPDSVGWVASAGSSIYDLSQVWIVTSVNGEGVTYACQ